MFKKWEYELRFPLVNTKKHIFNKFKYVCLVFDEVIGAHPFMRDHWHQFVRSVRLAQHNPSQFELAQSGGDTYIPALGPGSNRCLVKKNKLKIGKNKRKFLQRGLVAY